jgi:hypothetical protein
MEQVIIVKNPLDDTDVEVLLMFNCNLVVSSEGVKIMNVQAYGSAEVQ